MKKNILEFRIVYNKVGQRCLFLYILSFIPILERWLNILVAYSTFYQYWNKVETLESFQVFKSFPLIEVFFVKLNQNFK